MISLVIFVLFFISLVYVEAAAECVTLSENPLIALAPAQLQSLMQPTYRATLNGTCCTWITAQINSGLSGGDGLTVLLAFANNFNDCQSPTEAAQQDINGCPTCLDATVIPCPELLSNATCLEKGPGDCMWLTGTDLCNDQRVVSGCRALGDCDTAFTCVLSPDGDRIQFSDSCTLYPNAQSIDCTCDTATTASGGGGGGDIEQTTTNNNNNNNNNNDNNQQTTTTAAENNNGNNNQIMETKSSDANLSRNFSFLSLLILIVLFF